MSSHIVQHTQVLLTSWFMNLSFKLNSITAEPVLGFVSLLDITLSSGEITLEYFEQSLVSTKKHFIFLKVNILWRNCVFPQIRPDKNTEAIFSDNILVKCLAE